MQLTCLKLAVAVPAISLLVITLSSMKLLQEHQPSDSGIADCCFVIDCGLKARGITIIFPAFRGANRA